MESASLKLPCLGEERPRERLGERAAPEKAAAAPSLVRAQRPAGGASQPEEVAEEPLREAFRALLEKEGWWLLPGLPPPVPLMALEMCGNCGCGDWTEAAGLSRHLEEVDGAAPAGLLALSLPESLSSSPLWFKPSRGWPPSFILLHVGRTRYFKGRGPFCRRKEPKDRPVKRHSRPAAFHPRPLPARPPARPRGLPIYPSPCVDIGDIH